MSVAVFVWGIDEPRMVHLSRLADNAELDLGALDALRRVGLNSGRSLGTSVWRHERHWYGGGRIRELVVRREGT